MDGDDARLCVELLLIHLLHHLQDMPVEIGLPSRVGTAKLHVRACQRESRLDDRLQLLFARLYGRARQAEDSDFACLRIDHSEVVAGLNNVGHLGNHAIDAVGAEGDGMDEEVLHILRQLVVRARHFLSGEADIVLYAIELADEEVFVVGYQIKQFVFPLSRNRDDRTCLAGNSIAQATAFHGGEARLVISHRVFEEAEEQFDGTGTLQMDVASGVPAFAALERDFQRDVAFLGGNGLVVEGRGGVHAAGATYIQFAFRLRVEVQQGLALQPAPFEVKRTVHTRLFIYGNEHLQRRVYHTLIGEDSQRRCHADAVVCTEGGAVGGYPLTVIFDICLNGVGLKIEHLIAVLLRHHIHVPLQDHTRVVLHARAGGFTNQDVAYLIGQGF